MQVYKPAFKSKLTGKTKKCSHWYITFVDKLQIRRRLPAFVNNRATDRAAERIQELLDSGGFLRPELQAWLEKEIPPTMRERLIEWGIVDSRRISAHLGKRLAEHVDDFRAALEAKGNSARHVAQVARTLCGMFAKCGFKTWTDIDANRLYTYLADLRGDDGIGQRTFNAYLKHAKHFAKWMIQERRATSSPLEHLRCVTQTEKRRERRALDLDEQRRLLTTTAAGPEYHGLTGRERALIYQVALETGLRAGEIKHLTPVSFDFTACTVCLASAYTKNRKAAELDLKPQTAAEIQAHVAGRAPDAPAFAMPDRTAEMIRLDLEAAGIPYKVDGRRADFHGLRHSFITNLARAGVHPSDAQALARHSTITLTMNCYTHSLRADLKRIINEQPDLTAAPENLTVACLGLRSA